MGIDQAQYEALEKDFNEVLQQMVGERSMERFREEYEKLHRALKTSYESEKRLVKKCKELTDTIAGNLTRVKAAIKLTTEDSSTIGMLKKETERAWRLVEQAKEKEEKARKIIQDLKGEIAHLHKIVEQGSGLSFAQDNTVQQLMQQKETLSKEIEQSKEDYKLLQQQQNEVLEQKNRVEIDLTKEKDKVKELAAKLDESVNNMKRLERQKEGIEKECTSSNADKARLAESLTKTEAELKKTEEMLAISKAKEAQLENVNKDINQEKKQMQDNLSRFEQITRRNEDKIAKQKDRNDELETQITLLTQSEHRLKGAIDKIGREKEAKEREIKIQEDRRQEAEEEKDAAKSAVTALTREVEWLRKQTDLEKSDIMKLVRDRDMIKRTLAAVSDTNQKNRNEIIQKEQTIATTLEQNNKYKENI